MSIKQKSRFRVNQKILWKLQILIDQLTRNQKKDYMIQSVLPLMGRNILRRRRSTILGERKEMKRNTSTRTVIKKKRQKNQRTPMSLMK
jgi:hypothetical protein